MCLYSVAVMSALAAREVNSLTGNHGETLRANVRSKL